MMFNKTLCVLALSAVVMASLGGGEPSDVAAGLTGSPPSIPAIIPKRHGHGGLKRRSHTSGGHNGSKGSSGAPSPGPVTKPGSSQPNLLDEGLGTAAGVGSALTGKLVGRTTDGLDNEMSCTVGSLTCCTSLTKLTEEGQRQLLASMNIDTKKLIGPYIGTACTDLNMDGTQCTDNLQPLCCSGSVQNGNAVNCTSTDLS
jgi:hypothetical protein